MVCKRDKYLLSQSLKGIEVSVGLIRMKKKTTKKHEIARICPQPPGSNKYVTIANVFEKLLIMLDKFFCKEHANCDVNFCRTLI